MGVPSIQTVEPDLAWAFAVTPTQKTFRAEQKFRKLKASFAALLWCEAQADKTGRPPKYPEMTWSVYFGSEIAGENVHFENL